MVFCFHALFFGSNIVLWTHWMKQGSIYRGKTDGTNRTQFAPAGIMGSPSGLAFDWISRMMYYTNPTNKAIEVSVYTFLEHRTQLRGSVWSVVRWIERLTRWDSGTRDRFILYLLRYNIFNLSILFWYFICLINMKLSTWMCYINWICSSNITFNYHCFPVGHPSRWGPEIQEDPHHQHGQTWGSRWTCGDSAGPCQRVDMLSLQ